jgi:hypothetical protein
MDSTLRRVVAVAAHLKRTGRCPLLIHSLGAGDSAKILPTSDGFVDLSSGAQVKMTSSGVAAPGLREAIALDLDGDVGFVGYDPKTGERFSGRCGGGASVTVYDERSDFFQYAVSTTAE